MESDRSEASRERVGSISLDMSADRAPDLVGEDGLGQEPSRPTRRQALVAGGVLLGGGAAWWLTRRRDAPDVPPVRPTAPPSAAAGPAALWTYRGSDRMSVARLTEPPPLPVFVTRSELVTLDPATGAVRRRIRVPDSGAMTDHGPIGTFPGGGSLLPGANRVFGSGIGYVDGYHLTDAAADWRLAVPERLGGAESRLTLACCDGEVLYGYADTLHEADRGRILFALSAQTRELLWSRPDLADDALLDLTAAPGARLVGRSSRHNLVALDASTGERLWTTRADEQLGWCATGDRIACIGTGEGGLRVIRLDDGRDGWTLTPQPGDGWRCLKPLAAEGGLYVLRDSGEVTRHAVGDGRPLWSCRLPFRLDARCRPAFADGTLYVPGPAAGGVLAVDAEHGTVRWAFRDSGPGVDVWSVSLGQGRLFAGHDTLMYAVPLSN